MGRHRILGLGAGLGAFVAGVAAFFLQPGRGAVRRAAVRRGGETLARRSANVSTLVGSARRRSAGRLDAVRGGIEEGLIAALGAEGLALRVRVDEGTVTVRGEVSSLDLISEASRVIDSLEDGVEVINLVRLRQAPLRKG
jgi:osmotically-inducible protein OsmY